MSDRLEQLYEDLDNILTGIEDDAQGTETDIRDVLESTQDAVQDQQALMNELEDQDYRLGMHFLSRYYNTEFENEEQLESAEAHIDTLFIRNRYKAPFQDIGLPKGEISEPHKRPGILSLNPLEALGGSLSGSPKGDQNSSGGTNEDRRIANKALGAAVAAGFGAAGTLAVDGVIWESSQQNAGSPRETTRGSLNREEVEEIKSCLDEGSRDLRGLSQELDELLDEDEGRTLTTVEYVFDQSGSSRDVGSSFRYTIELEGGDEYIQGWYDAENSAINPLAEASNYDDLSEYAEENC